MLRFPLMILFILSMAGAQAQDSIDTEAPKEKRFSILVSAGPANESLYWTIAGSIDGTSPNIYSELIWSELKGTPLKFDAKWNFWRSFLIRTRITRMNINSGTVSDTDYEGDNRTQPVFDITVDAGAGSVSTFTGELGYRIIKGERFQLNGFAGYSSNKQNLFLLDPQGTLDKRLRSTYNTTWQGVSGAIEGTLAVSKVVQLTLHGTYNQVTYDATADWNLIETFQHPVSFEHHAKGFGMEGSFQIKFLLSDDVGFFLDTTFGEWQTGKGTDVLYLSDGQVQHTQLNAVVREYHGFGVGMVVQF